MIIEDMRRQKTKIVIIIIFFKKDILRADNIYLLEITVYFKENSVLYINVQIYKFFEVNMI